MKTKFFFFLMKETKFLNYLKKGKIQLKLLCKYNESFKKSYFGFSFSEMEQLNKKRHVFFSFDPEKFFEKNDTFEQKISKIKTWNEEQIEDFQIISNCEFCHKKGSFYNRDDVFYPTYPSEDFVPLDCCFSCKKILCGLDNVDIYSDYYIFSKDDLINFNNKSHTCAKYCINCKKNFCKNCITRLNNFTYICNKCTKLEKRKKK